jgi:hypothetical protein
MNDDPIWVIGTSCDRILWAHFLICHPKVGLTGKLIIEKNPELEYDIRTLIPGDSTVDSSVHQKWTFVMKKYFFDKFEEHEEISWNSPKDIKNGDIIFVYSTSPRKYINYILKATSNPYNKPSNDNDLRVKVQKRMKY